MSWNDAKFIATVGKLARARNMTPKDLCRKANIASDHLDRAQTGRNTQTIIRLADALNVHPLELIEPAIGDRN